ncbi:MAG: hypothetical protein M0P94_03040 [Candidatus Absconditabacterales bacterium]|nr:hypothetical protein [Candidatus Absconditabacterales bacterium]
MKKFGLLTTLLIGSLLLAGCNNNQETVPEENFVLTGGFSINSDMDTKKDEKTENTTDKSKEKYEFFIVERDDYYDIEIIDSELTDLQKKILKNYNGIKTNDESWNIESLNIFERERDKNSYKRWFYDPSFDVDGTAKYMNPGEDKDNLYLSLDFLENYAVSKQELPSSVQFGTIGIQAVDGYLGYGNGYIILFPYKFPVDKGTFTLAKQDRRYKVLNGGTQYHHYIGSDKDYIYLWDDDKYVIIKRIPKKSDFKVLTEKEEVKYIYDKNTGFEEVTSNYIGSELFVVEDSLVDYPPLYKDGNYLLVTSGIGDEYNYGIWRFPVDMDTLKVEKFTKPDPTYKDLKYVYYVVSDKDYYYQIIYSVNGYRKFQRIHK